jgi:hypothetical protein
VVEPQFPRDAVEVELLVVPGMLAVFDPELRLRLLLLVVLPLRLEYCPVLLPAVVVCCRPLLCVP